MAEKLQVKTGDVIHITGKFEPSVESNVLRYDAGGMIALHVPRAAAAIIVQYENGEYYTRPGRLLVKLARPVYTRATLKTLKTTDGILDISGHHCSVGDRYMADMLSLAEREYTHIDHPGRVWVRTSITVYDDDDSPLVLPIELLEIDMAA